MCCAWDQFYLLLCRATALLWLRDACKSLLNFLPERSEKNSAKRGRPFTSPSTIAVCQGRRRCVEDKRPSASRTFLCNRIWARSLWAQSHFWNHSKAKIKHWTESHHQTCGVSVWRWSKGTGCSPPQLSGSLSRSAGTVSPPSDWNSRCNPGDRAAGARLGNKKHTRCKTEHKVKAFTVTYYERNLVSWIIKKKNALSLLPPVCQRT